MSGIDALASTFSIFAAALAHGAMIVVLCWLSMATATLFIEILAARRAAVRVAAAPPSTQTGRGWLCSFPRIMKAQGLFRRSQAPAFGGP